MDDNVISSSIISMRDDSGLVYAIDESGPVSCDAAGVRVESSAVCDDSSGVRPESDAILEEHLCSSFSGVRQDSASVVNLLGLSMRSVNENFQLYNDYAFRLGFSVRKG